MWFSLVLSTMFLIQIADVLDDGIQLRACGSECILRARHLALDLGAGDEAIVQELAQSFIENLRRDAGDEALQLPRA